MEKLERAAALIIKNRKILLMYRFYKGQEYYVFPGGAVEKNESPKEAAIREIKEEFCLDIKINKLLFKAYNPGDSGFPGRDEFYYLTTDFTGIPTIGGAEKEHLSESNIYEPRWIELNKVKDLILYPQIAKDKFLETLDNGVLNVI